MYVEWFGRVSIQYRLHHMYFSVNSIILLYSCHQTIGKKVGIFVEKQCYLLLMMEISNSNLKIKARMEIASLCDISATQKLSYMLLEPCPFVSRSIVL